MAENPRGLSDAAVQKLLLEDKCPMCLGELDTGWECNDCDYDAKPLADRYNLDSLRANAR